MINLKTPVIMLTFAFTAQPNRVAIDTLNQTSHHKVY